jgi:cell division protein FtsB
MPQDAAPKPKPLLLLLALALLVYLGANTSSTLYKSFQNGQRLDNLQNQVTQLEHQRSELQRQLAYQQSDQFVEQQARNQLSLAKANETIVIFPRQSSVLGMATSQSAAGTSRPPAAASSSNLDAWTKLFWP